jgi:hypothetical protein
LPTDFFFLVLAVFLEDDVKYLLDPRAADPVRFPVEDPRIFCLASFHCIPLFFILYTRAQVLRYQG